MVELVEQVMLNIELLSEIENTVKVVSALLIAMA